MNRRAFCLGLGGLTLVFRQQADSTRPTGAADQLRDPTGVGTLRAPTQSLDNDAVITGVERRLKCTCGCNLDIFTCRTTDFTCSYSPALHREVIGLYTGGQSAEAIVQAFIAKYGESILLAPRTEGFNLVGYLLPGALVTAIGAALALVLIRRHRVRLAPAASPPPPTEPLVLSPDERARLDRALGQLEP